MTHPHERGLTTRGRSMIAGGLAAAVCAVLLDERDLLRVGLLAAALPLFAAAYVLLRRPRRMIASHRAVPDRFSPGDQGQIVVTLTNRSALRTGAMQVIDRPTAGISGGARYLLPPLRRGGSAVVSYRIDAARRGRYRIGGTALRIVDPFGLCVMHRRLASRADVIVTPTVVPLSGLPRAVGTQTLATESATGGQGGGYPDSRVRPYTPGDDIRTIHWRASARRDELVVRTRETMRGGDVVVLVDHRDAAYSGDDLEVAISLAASVALHLVAHDLDVTMIGHDGEPIAGNDPDGILLALTDLEPSDRPLVAPRGTGLVIAVTGLLSETEAHLLTATHSHGWAFGVHGQPDLAATRLLTAAGWHYVDAGSDVTQAWLTACGTTVPQGGNRV